MRRNYKKCVIWTRVSEKNQNTIINNDIEKQRQLCQIWANLNNYEIVAEFGVRGNNKVQEKGIEEMYDYLKRHKSISHIIVSGYDRLSRDKKKVREIFNTFWEIGVCIGDVTFELNPENAIQRYGHCNWEKRRDAIERCRIMRKNKRYDKLQK